MVNKNHFAAASLIVGVLMASAPAHAQYDSYSTPPGRAYVEQRQQQYEQDLNYLNGQARLRAQVLGEKLAPMRVLCATNLSMLDKGVSGVRNDDVWLTGRATRVHILKKVRTPRNRKAVQAQIMDPQIRQNGDIYYFLSKDIKQP